MDSEKNAINAGKDAINSAKDAINTEKDALNSGKMPSFLSGHDALKTGDLEDS